MSEINTGGRYVFRHMHGPRPGDGETVTVTPERFDSGGITLYGIIRESGREGLAFAVELTERVS